MDKEGAGQIKNDHRSDRFIEKKSTDSDISKIYIFIEIIL